MKAKNAFKKSDNAPWTAREDLVVQIASPEIAAAKLGRSIESVVARRETLGPPARLPRGERLDGYV